MKNKLNKIKAKVKKVKVAATPVTSSLIFCREDRNDCPAGMNCSNNDYCVDNTTPTTVTPTPVTPKPTSFIFCKEDRNDCPAGMTCNGDYCV